MIFLLEKQGKVIGGNDNGLSGLEVVKSAEEITVSGRIFKIKNEKIITLTIPVFDGSLTIEGVSFYELEETVSSFSETEASAFVPPVEESAEIPLYGGEAETSAEEEVLPLPDDEPPVPEDDIIPLPDDSIPVPDEDVPFPEEPSAGTTVEEGHIPVPDENISAEGPKEEDIPPLEQEEEPAAPAEDEDEIPVMEDDIPEFNQFGAEEERGDVFGGQADEGNNEEAQIAENQDNVKITLSLDEEDDEITEFLNKDIKEIKEIIKKELQSAAKEMDIEDDEEMLNELFEELLKQIEESRKPFFKYIKEVDYENIHKTAHMLKGAALNLRISSFANILKYIDELSKEKEDILKIKEYVENFYRLLEKYQSGNYNLNKGTLLSPEKVQFVEKFLAKCNEEKIKSNIGFLSEYLGLNPEMINSCEKLNKLIKK